MNRTMIVLCMLTVVALPVWAADGYCRQISVTGEAAVYVVPDKIIVNLGVETWDADMATAKQKNNDILVKAVAAIKELGVEEKEVQTGHLSIEPRYKDGDPRQDFIGYFVRNRFLVTLSEVEKVEELVTKMLEVGVNYIHGIDFQTIEVRKYRDEARELALKAAREKAGDMASVLGQKIGRPLQICETPSYGGYYGSSWRGGYGASMTQNSGQDIAGSGAEISDTVALGKLAIKANVSVTFELVD